MYYNYHNPNESVCYAGMDNVWCGAANYYIKRITNDFTVENACALIITNQAIVHLNQGSAQRFGEEKGKLGWSHRENLSQMYADIFKSWYEIGYMRYIDPLLNNAKKDYYK